MRLYSLLFLTVIAILPGCKLSPQQDVTVAQTAVGSAGILACAIVSLADGQAAGSTCSTDATIAGAVANTLGSILSGFLPSKATGPAAPPVVRAMNIDSKIVVVSLTADADAWVKAHTAKGVWR